MVGIEEQAAVVALARRPDASRPAIAELVSARGSALDVLRFPDAGATGQETLFDIPASHEPLEPIIEEIRGWNREGIRLLTVLDSDYPANLRHVRDRPAFLFARGESRTDELSVAVVGTRHPSDAGIRQATQIARGLAEHGVTVISGLAQGIDTAAHVAALSVRGRTVAVIGTGLRRAYPAQNAALQNQIGRFGLVLSQFWPDAPPTKQSFPLRNAVITGCCLATVVIEAQERSGTRIAARLAHEQGRQVFLVSSLLEQEWARQFSKLPNTTVVDNASDVFNALEATRRTPEPC